MDIAILSRIEYLEENILGLATRLDVIETKIDRGLEQIERRFDQLESWLKERL